MFSEFLTRPEVNGVPVVIKEDIVIGPRNGSQGLGAYPEGISVAIASSTLGTTGWPAANGIIETSRTDMFSYQRFFLQNGNVGQIRWWDSSLNFGDGGWTSPWREEGLATSPVAQFHVTKSVQQTDIVANTLVRVSLGNKVEDPSTVFNTTSNLFTAPVSGWYLFYGAVYWAGITTGGFIYRCSLISATGTELKFGPAATSNTTVAGSGFVCQHYLNAGDQVAMGAITSNNSTTTRPDLIVATLTNFGGMLLRPA